MPPKRSSGESKQGLVITLVFFILATIGLGVSTYFGYSEQEAKDKAKADAEKKLGDMTAERDWYKFQWNLARRYMGVPVAAETATEVGVKKANFDRATAPGKGEAASFADAVATRKAAEGTLGGWNAAQNKPAMTYEELLADWKARYDKLQDVSAKLQQNLAAAEKRAQDLTNEKEAARKDYDNRLAEQKKKAEEDLAADQKQIAALRGELDKLGTERDNVKKEIVLAQQSQAKAETKQKRQEEELKAKDKQLKDTVENLQQTNSRLTALYEKSGVDRASIEQRVLDKQAVAALQNWQENWKIVRLTGNGKMPYINLGSADRVTPGLTFSVHGVGPNGKPLPVVKGTIEVVRVLEPHLSQARVTSVADPNREPILTGDMLFNPSWHPTQTKHIALVGLVDLVGDGRDSLPELLRGLRRQGVEVDTWTDPKDGRMLGKGLTNQTDYLVVGQGSEGLTGRASREQKLGPAIDKDIRDLKEKATASGVPVVSLKKYLELIGYRVPRPLPEGSAPNRPLLQPYSPYSPRGNR